MQAVLSYPCCLCIPTAARAASTPDLSCKVANLLKRFFFLVFYHFIHTRTLLYCFFYPHFSFPASPHRPRGEASFFTSTPKKDREGVCFPFECEDIATCDFAPHHSVCRGKPLPSGRVVSRAVAGDIIAELCAVRLFQRFGRRKLITVPALAKDRIVWWRYLITKLDLSLLLESANAILSARGLCVQDRLLCGVYADSDKCLDFLMFGCEALFWSHLPALLRPETGPLMSV